MSKRKYSKDVSCIYYTGYQNGGRDISPELWGILHIENDFPVRIIRESFFRKVIKAYEREEAGK